jgi:hypothetical protein
LFAVMGVVDKGPGVQLVAQTLDECQKSHATHRKCTLKLKKAYATHREELQTGLMDAIKRAMLVFKREP